MSIELKIKSKHLSEEAKIIRYEEQKLKKTARRLREKQDRAKANKIMFSFDKLQQHRKWGVRNEQRATYLARAYLQDRPYTDAEPKCNDTYKRDCWITDRVVKMVNKYGKNKVERSDIIKWFNA
jgi:hypothetical protein